MRKPNLRQDVAAAVLGASKSPLAVEALEALNKSDRDVMAIGRQDADRSADSLETTCRIRRSLGAVIVGLEETAEVLRDHSGEVDAFAVASPSATYLVIVDTEVRGVLGIVRTTWPKGGASAP